MAAALDPVIKNNQSRETGWVNRLFNRDGYTPEYQELKFTLHRKLLDRINLEALSSMAGERVRAEIRSAVAKLVEEEKTPLSLVEKDRVIEDTVDSIAARFRIHLNIGISAGGEKPLDAGAHHGHAQRLIPFQR